MDVKYVDEAVHARIILMGEREDEMEALVDTGADVTGIPLDKCVDVGFKVEGFRLFRGLFGAGFLPTFRATVKLKGIAVHLTVVGLLRGGPVIGRDLLEKFKVLIDLKNREAKIEDP